MRTQLEFLSSYYGNDEFNPQDPKWRQDEGHWVELNSKLQKVHQILHPESHLLNCPKDFQTYGDGVGVGKKICGLHSIPNCDIFSLGSNNLFSFEESLISQTNCTIYTFDCTSEPPANQNPRLRFVKQCMGQNQQQPLQLNLFPYAPGRTPNGWGSRAQYEIIKKIQLVSYQDILNQLSLKSVAVLKIDVEGAEYSVLSDILSKEDNVDAPFQILLETHWWDRDIGHAMMTMSLFEELWRSGYRVMFREDQADKSCFEWSFMRVFC